MSAETVASSIPMVVTIFAVLNETASGISLAYNVSIPGYPQAAPLLSTAYENQDYNGDGQADGRVYLYFTYNAKPGGIYMLSDEPGQTSGTAVELSVRQVTSRNTVSVPSAQTGKAPFITKMIPIT